MTNWFCGLLILGPQYDINLLPIHVLKDSYLLDISSLLCDGLHHHILIAENKIILKTTWNNTFLSILVLNFYCRYLEGVIK